MSDNTIDEWLELGAAELREVAERPRREAEILLGHCLNRDRLYLITHLDEVVEAREYLQMIKRRSSNEPIEYITSNVSFFFPKSSISVREL
jgi:release factor glutamine methyltransferase